jgi:hypothetical protein
LLAGFTRFALEPLSELSIIAFFGIPVEQIVSQLSKPQIRPYRHSGLDPESSAVSGSQVAGCRSKIPSLEGISSGMMGVQYNAIKDPMPMIIQRRINEANYC